MDSSKYNIGKIKSYDNFVGEIVAKDGTYIFTSYEVLEEPINPNDMVIFRGEQIQNINKAFFIKRINPEKDLKSSDYKKTKKISTQGE